MKTSSFSSKKIIGRFWYLFLLLALASSLAASLGVTFKTNPTKEQKFSFFFALSEDKVNSALLETSMRKVAPSLKKVTITSSSPDSSMYSSFLSTYATNADLQFFPRSALTEDLLKNFLELPQSYKESINFFDAAGVAKGYEVKGGQRKLLADYITWGEEDYFLFILKSSSHISPFVEGRATNYVQEFLSEVLK